MSVFICQFRRVRFAEPGLRTCHARSASRNPAYVHVMPGPLRGTRPTYRAHVGRVPRSGPASVNMSFCRQPASRRRELHVVRAARDDAVAWLQPGTYADQIAIPGRDLDIAPGKTLAARL